MNLNEAMSAFRQHVIAGKFDEKGVFWMPGAEPNSYLPDEFRSNPQLAMDAVADIPTLQTDPNSSLPSLFTTFVDPQTYEVLFSPNEAANIMGEVRKGDWLTQTAIFQVAEATGETSSYGDFNNNGRAGVNVNFPQLQSYPFQVIKEYGEMELARMGLARINWVGEIDRAAAITLNKFSNFTYFFGVSGLSNFGLLNNPYLSASLTPGPKAAGGTAWTNANSQIVATANEIFADIQALFIQLIAQNPGLVTQGSKMTLALSPVSAGALTATNTFNVNVDDLLKKNFPNLTVKQAVQYQVKSSRQSAGYCRRQPGAADRR